MKGTLIFGYLPGRPYQSQESYLQDLQEVAVVLVVLPVPSASLPSKDMHVIAQDGNHPD